jgi:hypothetical protein
VSSRADILRRKHKLSTSWARNGGEDGRPGEELSRIIDDRLEDDKE